MSDRIVSYLNNAKCTDEHWNKIFGNHTTTIKEYNMKHKVWFEIFGKKMLVEIEANNPEDAKAAIKSKIRFHKIEKIEEPRDSVVEHLMNMFNIK